jgi:hypothetical protein
LRWEARKELGQRDERGGKHDGRDKTHEDSEGEDTEEERNRSGGKRSTLGPGMDVKVGPFTLSLERMLVFVLTSFLSLSVCVCAHGCVCFAGHHRHSVTRRGESAVIDASSRFLLSADAATSCDWLHFLSIWGCFQLRSYHPMSSLQLTPSLHFQSSYRHRWRTSAHEMHSSHF